MELFQRKYNRMSYVEKANEFEIQIQRIEEEIKNLSETKELDLKQL